MNTAISVACLSFVVLGLYAAILAYFEFRSRDPETTRRKWTAVSPAGNVNLGSRITYAEALQRATRLGSVAYTDMELGYIFYNVTQGTGQASGEF